MTDVESRLVTAGPNCLSRFEHDRQKNDETTARMTVAKYVLFIIGCRPVVCIIYLIVVVSFIQPLISI